MADNIGVRPNTTGAAVQVATDDISGIHYPVYKHAYGADGTATLVSESNPLPVTDYWLKHAVNVIQATYGDIVSVEAKHKDLNKFGHNNLVGTTETTIAHMMPGILEETYLTDNLITEIISTNASDTEEMVVEGHTTADGGLTFAFISQTVTLTGQTAASLTTPLARVTRAYNNNGTELVGNIYIGETDTYTAGVPNTPAKNHLWITAGEQQSEKCETTVSNTDYWIVTSFQANFLKKTAGFAEVDFQVRLAGKVFRSRDLISCNDGARGEHTFKPYYIIPKNSDVRLTVVADASNTAISGSIQGVLAKVIG